MIIEESGSVALSLSPEMLARIEEAAREEGCTKSELIHEALRKYLSDRRWRRMLQESREMAEKHGITPGDVERLIDEYREEAGRTDSDSN